jgi:hypothetical protein
MKFKLTENELAALLPKIQQVLETGTLWEDKCLHHPTGAIIAAVMTIPGMELVDHSGGFIANGWQYDWRQYFKHSGKEYTLRGSGYYGGHSFHISD